MRSENIQIKSISVYAQSNATHPKTVHGRKVSRLRTGSIEMRITDASRIKQLPILTGDRVTILFRLLIVLMGCLLNLRSVLIASGTEAKLSGRIT